MSKKIMLGYALLVTAGCEDYCQDCGVKLEEAYCQDCGSYNPEFSYETTTENDISAYSRKERKLIKSLTPKSKKTRSLKKAIKKNGYNQFPVISAAEPLTDTRASSEDYGLEPGFRKETVFEKVVEETTYRYTVPGKKVDELLTGLALMVAVDPSTLSGLLAHSYEENCPEDNIYDSQSGMILWGKLLTLVGKEIGETYLENCSYSFENALDLFISDMLLVTVSPKQIEKRANLLSYFETEIEDEKFDKIYLRLFSTLELKFAKMVNAKEEREVYFLETNKWCEYDGHIPMTLTKLPEMDKVTIKEMVNNVAVLDKNGLFQ